MNWHKTYTGRGTTFMRRKRIMEKNLCQALILLQKVTKQE